MAIVFETLYRGYRDMMLLPNSQEVGILHGTIARRQNTRLLSVTEAPPKLLRQTCKPVLRHFNRQHRAEERYDGACGPEEGDVPAGPVVFFVADLRNVGHGVGRPGVHDVTKGNGHQFSGSSSEADNTQGPDESESQLDVTRHGASSRALNLSRRFKEEHSVNFSSRAAASDRPLPGLLFSVLDMVKKTNKPKIYMYRPAGVLGGIDEESGKKMPMTLTHSLVPKVLLESIEN
ncbi:hypothetical protein FB451DRAFT_1168214 [Mycena latifolia]|nr:hypothetical protein FB451DRAFT_1168214 [Mycena latifolia]